MKKLESDLYQELKGIKAHWNRIENSIMTGEPDVNVFFHSAKHENWLELKIVHNGRIEVRHSQLRWILHRVFYAGATNVWIVARDGKRLMVYDPHVIYRDADAAKKFPVEAKARVDKDSITFHPSTYAWAMSDPVDWGRFVRFISEGNGPK